MSRAETLEKWGETPTALWFLAKKCDVLRSYRIFGVTPMVGKRPPLTLRFKLRVIHPATCCAHIFCFSWRKSPPDLLCRRQILNINTEEHLNCGCMARSTRRNGNAPATKESGWPRAKPEPRSGRKSPRGAFLPAIGDKLWFKQGGILNFFIFAFLRC